MIKKYLQVFNYETNKDGWFNYDFNNDNLFWFSIKSLKARDFNDFVQQVFEVLWHRTDENLTLIREKIQIDIAKLFNDSFNDLEREIVSLLGVQNSPLLSKAIKDCSTETQTVISRISSWFKRSGTITSDFKLNNLIDIVMEYANKSNPHKKINLERDLNFDNKIKGEYLTHFADLLRIFMENILKHSDESSTIINSKIITNQHNDNYLCITIENDITNKNSLDALKNVWNSNIIDVNKLLNEGKSGYHKAYKILTYDLRIRSNYLNTKISESEDKFAVSLFINVKELLV